jgi:hypothetical protein
MPQHIMNETDFYNLRVCWNDFLFGISRISIDQIHSDQNKTEWTKLRSSFDWVNGRRYTHQEIVTESMANLLHKYMAFACTSFLVREIEESCPGWPWLLMEMDAQVAKGKGTHRKLDVEQVGRYGDAEMRSTDMSMLLQQLNPLHV